MQHTNFASMPLAVWSRGHEAARRVYWHAETEEWEESSASEGKVGRVVRTAVMRKKMRMRMKTMTPKGVSL